MAFADAKNGWVGGNKGTQLHTVNGGASWAAQNLSKKQTLYAALFTDAAIGWEAGSNGAIRHTANGGSTWAMQTSGTRAPLYGAAFAGAGNGWVVGAGGAIRHTANGGTTWGAQTSGTRQNLRAVAGAGGNLYAVGDGGTIVAFIADLTPPTTTAAGLQADQLTGWTDRSVVVSLTASDAGSGVAATYYTVDGGGEKTYAGSFTVSGAGQHPVTYWSVDKAGNVEATHTGWANIGNPYAEASGLAADTHSGWRNTGTTVTITGGGANGPFTIVYQVDSGSPQTVDSPATLSVSGVGSHEVDYYAYPSSNPSLQSVHLTGYVNIETTPPTTTAGPVPTGWRHLAVVVPLNATDALSGVATTYYRIDGRNWQTAAGAATVPAPTDHTMDGRHVVSYYSVDVAGNIEAAKQFVARIDTRRPRTRAPYAASVVRTHYVALKCKIVDARPCAPRATLRIVVKNSHGVVKWQHKYASTRVNVLLSKRFLCKLPRGTYRFVVYAVDRAGNTQSKAASNRLTVR